MCMCSSTIICFCPLVFLPTKHQCPEAKDSLSTYSQAFLFQTSLKEQLSVKKQKFAVKICIIKNKNRYSISANSSLGIQRLKYVVDIFVYVVSAITLLLCSKCCGNYSRKYGINSINESENEIFLILYSRNNQIIVYDLLNCLLLSTDKILYWRVRKLLTVLLYFLQVAVAVITTALVSGQAFIFPSKKNWNIAN